MNSVFSCNKFTLKPIKARKKTSRSNLQFSAKQRNEEFGEDIPENIDLKLNNTYYSFDNKSLSWICEGKELPSYNKRASNENLTKAQQEIISTKEENNLLNMKLEVALHMMAELKMEQDLSK
ncbi:hypothetical protein SNEBB_005348 [Seison nebaliae]|nr:hypothetical protein SNEBB_005348 [Seison nebaliae]